MMVTIAAFGNYGELAVFGKMTSFDVLACAPSMRTRLPDEQQFALLWRQASTLAVMSSSISASGRCCHATCPRSLQQLH
jgi:hypothetical protein